MKKLIVGFLFILISTSVLAQNTSEEIKELSKKKWEWMADKNVNELTSLFHKDAQFVHMGGA